MTLPNKSKKYKKHKSHCVLFLVTCEGVPFAAYPHPKQAEVYASGFSKPVSIVKGTFIADDEFSKHNKG